VSRARHYRSPIVRAHRRSLLAALIELFPAFREAYLQVMLAGLAPQISGLVARTLRDMELSPNAIENPNPAVEYVIGLIEADYRSDFLDACAKNSLAYEPLTTSHGKYPRSIGDAVTALAHLILKGSYADTATFLNEGIPRRDLQNFGLSPKNVWDAFNRYDAKVEAKAAEPGITLDAVRGTVRYELGIVSMMLELINAARDVETYQRLSGAELGKALAAREDLVARANDAGGLSKLKEIVAFGRSVSNG
jgi:hypothetical protein